MKRHVAGMTLLAVAIATLQGCKTGYNRTHNPPSTDTNPPDCATAPANGNVTEQGEKVFNLIAGLTCASSDYQDGYMVGQSLGYGNQLNTGSSATGVDNTYSRLVEGFDSVTSHMPAVIAIDYEGDQLYTKEELLDANTTLKKHWDEGGLVSISWMPLSPWKNDFSNIASNRGTAGDRRYITDSDVDLQDLLDETTDMGTVWTNKLTAMAEVLEDLQDKGVVVLWRPLPEMNNGTYWWGTQASDPENNTAGAERYTALWEHMFEFFKERNINNLLWVYSPAESSVDYLVDWAYPGDGYVDVVAGIARHDQLVIKDYKALIDLGRPVAMAEYGPTSDSLWVQSPLTGRGSFDNTLYVDRLNGRYPAVAYWVSNHSGLLEADVRSNLALVDNENSKALMDSNLVISAERLIERKARE